MSWQFLFDVVAGLVFLSIPILLFIELYIGHSAFAGFFQKCGFGRREVGLLVVGATFSTFWYGDIPLYVSGGTLLAINLTGAFLPIAISIHLFRTKISSKGMAALGVLVVSVVTYMVTTFEPSIGVYSEFPYFLFPSMVAAGLGYVLYKRDATIAAPYAYVVATIGVLIGADIVRIPEIISALQLSTQTGATTVAAGSIGGAGIMDMVFIAGLLAMAPHFLTARKSLKESPRILGRMEGIQASIDATLDRAEIAYTEGHFHLAVTLAMKAVEQKARKAGARYGLKQEPSQVLRTLGLNPYHLGDFNLLIAIAEGKDHSQVVAYRCLVTARNLMLRIHALEIKSFATIKARSVAYIFDMLFLVALWISAYVVLVSIYPSAFKISDPFGSVWFMAFLLLMLASEMVYFTTCETLWGRTLGKRLVKIRVVEVDQTRLGFMGALTRNMIRPLDFLPLGYIIGYVTMSRNPWRQRIGDYLAGTIVMRG